MTQSFEAQMESSARSQNLPGAGKGVGILGVPLGYGASMAGVDMGPAALRVAGLTERVAKLGYSVRDLGDMRLERPRKPPEQHDKLKYVSQISSACEELAREVEQIVTAG